MIPISNDHRSNVGISPLIKVAVITICARWPDVVPDDPLLFALGPFVKRLVHDKKSQAVAQVEKFRRWWVVATTNRVAAARFEKFQSPLPYFNGDSRAKSARVVVQADTLHFHSLAVDRKTT